MSHPRRLLPRQTHAVSRRVSERRFLLRPSPFVNDVVRYALARASQLCPRVAVHGLVAESNHTHASLTDLRTDLGEISQIPRFNQCLNRMVAAALNARHGRGENLWAPGSYHNVEIHSRLSLEQQLLYLWTNPVKDGLVERPEDWPGVLFLPEDFGSTVLVRKPEGAFFGGRRPRTQAEKAPTSAVDRWHAELAHEEAEARERMRSSRGSRPRPPRNRSRLPEEIELTIHPPPGYEDLTLEEVRAHFRRLLDAEVARIHAERRAAGRTRFLGVEAVLAQDPLARSGDTWPSFATAPRIACRGNVERRVELLVGLSEWRANHRQGYEVLIRQGTAKAVFPPGSHAWSALPDVRIRGAPPSRGRCAA